MDDVSVKIPTPYGSIWVNATKSSVDICVPCNTRAVLCIAVADWAAALDLLDLLDLLDAGLQQQLTLDGAT